MLTPKGCMLNLDISDDCYFGVPYLLHLKFVFDKICWIGKHFNSIQDIVKIWHAF